MEYMNILRGMVATEDSKILYLLGLILIANIIDFSLGWINAKFNKKVAFISSKAIFGIARKMVLYIILVFFIPVSLLVPEPIGYSALYILFIGYLASEMHSIFAHLKVAGDEKESELFADFFNKIIHRGDKS